MTGHPYQEQPDRAFWSRAVVAGFQPADLCAGTDPLLRPGDRVASAGSCFASELIPWLERTPRITYVREERPHPVFAHLPENLGYRDFSAAYGNIYTARHLRQLLERAWGEFAPIEDRWHVGEFVVDPFRPGLRHPARSDGEFDVLTAQHLAAVRRVVEVATVLVFTVGMTEAWESAADGAVFPACPGTISGVFDADRHRLHNFRVDEVRDDLLRIIALLRAANPELRVILTVSPVPMIATATAEHVVTATTYSKSVLRAAAGEVAALEPAATYYPAYEIVMGQQSAGQYLAADRRHVTPAGLHAVMATLLAGVQGGERGGAVRGAAGEVELGDGNGAVPAVPVGPGPLSAEELSRRIAEAECDDMLADMPR